MFQSLNMRTDEIHLQKIKGFKDFKMVFPKPPDPGSLIVPIHNY